MIHVSLDCEQDERSHIHTERCIVDRASESNKVCIYTRAHKIISRQCSHRQTHQEPVPSLLFPQVYEHVTTEQEYQSDHDYDDEKIYIDIVQLSLN